MLSVAKRYRFDLDSQAEDGFDIYLSCLRFLLSNTTPILVGIGFAILTLVLLLWSRPRRKDVFSKIETIGPREKLERIAAMAENDSKQAAQDLLEMLKVYPEYQPVHVFYAEWHYNQKSYELALHGYDAAFKLGPATAMDYFRASLSASRSGRSRRALSILQEATRKLSTKKIPPVFYFNIGCYYSRLGKHDEAIRSLGMAYRAGFRKKKSFLEDPDLKPLRSRSDFRALVKGVCANGS